MSTGLRLFCPAEATDWSVALLTEREVELCRSIASRLGLAISINKEHGKLYLGRGKMPPPQPAARWLRLTRTGERDAYGCEWLLLQLRRDDNKILDSMRVVSGAPSRQVFRAAANAVSGRLEPIPEGNYTDLGPVEWAGKSGDYSASWGSGLGPVWVDLFAPRAIGLHLDANRQSAPGSAGCVCPVTVADLERVVSWWQDGRPERLVVDWGLGTL